MDLSLSDEEREIRDWVRTFVTREVMPLESTVLERVRRNERGLTREELRTLREEADSLADALAAEQHDPEEARLEEKGGENFVAHQGADHGTGLVGEHAPVGAELVGHDDAGDDTHAEGDGEDLLPVVEEVAVDRFLLPQPEAFEDGEIAGEPDRKRREYDVERHRESKLRPGQYDRIPALEHRTHPSQLD
jgi:hypothetical protein